MSELNPYDLEEHLIPVHEWFECPYPHAVEIANKERESGYPCGISNTPDGEWHVLIAGQGTFVAWSSTWDDGVESAS